MSGPAAPPRRSPADRLVPGAALLAVVLFPFTDVVFRGRVLYDRDIHLLWAPRVESFVRVIAEGSWPLWARGLSFGQPLLALPNTQAAYPTTWLNLVLLPSTVYGLYAVGHVALGAFGMYVLARRWDLAPPAALAGAVAWAASGPVLSLVGLWNHLAGAAWLPWVVVAAEALVEAPTPRRVVTCALALAAPVLAGSPESLTMSAAAAIVVPAGRSWRGRPVTAPSFARLAAASAAALVLALGLAAVQWLPSVEMARRSTRDAFTSETRAYWSLPSASLAAALLPLRLERLPLDRETTRRWFEGREPYLASTYLGLAALPLVVLGAAGGGRRSVVLCALVVLAALVSLGPRAPVYGLLTAVLPPVRAFRYPAKAIVLCGFAWAALAALGADRLARAARAPRPFLASSAAAAALALAVAVAVARPERWPPGVLAASATAESLRPATNALLWSAAVLAVGTAAARLLGGGGAAAAATTALALDLLVAGLGLLPTAPAALYRFRPGLVDRIRGEPHERVYAYDYVVERLGERHLGHPGFQLRPITAPWEGALALRAYGFPTILPSWGLEAAFEADPNAMRPPEVEQLAARLRVVEGTPAHLRLLQMGSVTHVIALHDDTFRDLALEERVEGPFVEPIRLFRVPDPLPRAYAVGRVRAATGAAALAVLVGPGFDPHVEVVLDATEPGVPPEGGPANGSVAVVDRRSDRVVLEAVLDAPAYVVLTDAFDPGWRARVDGREAAILRANHAFRAVRVGAGRHRIEQVYRPRAASAGAAATLVAAALAAMLWTGGRLRASRRAGAGGR